MFIYTLYVSIWFICFCMLYMFLYMYSICWYYICSICFYTPICLLYDLYVSTCIYSIYISIWSTRKCFYMIYMLCLWSQNHIETMAAQTYPRSYKKSWQIYDPRCMLIESYACDHLSSSFQQDTVLDPVCWAFQSLFGSTNKYLWPAISAQKHP